MQSHLLEKNFGQNLGKLGEIRLINVWSNLAYLGEIWINLDKFVQIWVKVTSRVYT